MRRILWMSVLASAACATDEVTVYAPDGGASDDEDVRYQFVQNTLSMPTGSSEYAIDLDGNGSKDNALGSLIGLLGEFYSIQDSVTASMDEGSLVYCTRSTPTLSMTTLPRPGGSMREGPHLHPISRAMVHML